MSMRAPVRWKEWITLVTQQQRLRNLIQVIAYNMRHDRAMENNTEFEPYSYYYTLHSTIMGSPFYMSEKLESEHPKWTEVEFPPEHGTYTGVIIRLWQHCSHSDTDSLLTVSGVYFSGLVYIGPRLLQIDPAQFKPNTIIFYMHGGYFTCPNNYLSVQPEPARHFNISLDMKHVRRSYTINMLSKLHSLQQEIKREVAACEELRQKIAEGGSHDKSNNRMTSAALRRLLSRSKSSASREHIASVKLKIEDVRFRVHLLRSERQRKETRVKCRHGVVEREKEVLQDLGCDLMHKYRTLNKDINRLKERKQLNEERRQIAMNISVQLVHRRRQLISDLNYIFPIVEVSPERYEICSVFLASSESLSHSSSDTATAVGLGLVASLIQAIATFLSLPLSYPVIQCNSRSRVVDPITVDIPNQEREFALYPKGSYYKHEFHYGVYLINKNIAQLRQAYGLPYVDAKNTLANLYSLLNHKESMQGLTVGQESSCRSNLDPSPLPTISSSLRSSPLYLHKTVSAPIMIWDKVKEVRSSSVPSPGTSVDRYYEFGSAISDQLANDRKQSITDEYGNVTSDQQFNDGKPSNTDESGHVISDQQFNDGKPSNTDESGHVISDQQFNDGKPSNTDESGNVISDQLANDRKPSNTDESGHVISDQLANDRKQSITDEYGNVTSDQQFNDGKPSNTDESGHVISDQQFNDGKPSSTDESGHVISDQQFNDGKPSNTDESGNVISDQQSNDGKPSNTDESGHVISDQQSNDGKPSNTDESGNVPSDQQSNDGKQSNCDIEDYIVGIVDAETGRVKRYVDLSAPVMILHPGEKMVFYSSESSSP